jgi:hypothetical protein
MNNVTKFWLKHLEDTGADLIKRNMKILKNYENGGGSGFTCRVKTKIH